MGEFNIGLATSLLEFSVLAFTAIAILFRTTISVFEDSPINELSLKWRTFSLTGATIGLVLHSVGMTSLIIHISASIEEAALPSILTPSLGISNPAFALWFDMLILSAGTFVSTMFLIGGLSVGYFTVIRKRMVGTEFDLGDKEPVREKKEPEEEETTSDKEPTS